MVAQPAPPDRMIGAPRRDDRPEARPMPEDPKVSQLVKDDRFERLGWGQDQAPRKRNSAVQGGAAPARPLVADADGDWGDGEGCRVALDLALDLDTGARPEPPFEDGRRGAPVSGRQADHDLVLGGAADPFDTGPAAALADRLEPEPMEIPAETEQPTVPQPATRGELGTIPGVTIEVAAEPRFALDKERPNLQLSIRPTSATGWRDGHDNAALGVDHDTQAAGSG